eukprot:TRINITY_DN462_c2_g1_i1.p1 TRINITY_DN462_c2_g1~~TRINITY_DN462_c2_g1_i1.p1  ORF type:complete len:210 (-),score=44.76 TRINITY_DN462_c2_g1_i1:578-1207(-)
MSTSDREGHSDHLFKILLIGDSGTGKTCLLLRFTDNTWAESHIATLGVDFKIKTMKLDNKVIKLQLWDTAGQEQFRTLTRTYFRGAHGIVIVFDCTSRSSFFNVQQWLDEIRGYDLGNIVTALVGNKTDMAEARVITTSEATKFAESVGIRYFETSAKTGQNVMELFTWLARSLKENSDKSPQASPQANTVQVGQKGAAGSGKGCCTIQ